MSNGLSRRVVIQSALASAALLNCKGGCKGGGSSSGGEGGGDTIKVGVLMTLSGPQGGIGQELQRGMKLAFEQLGMKAGNKKIELVEKDDKNDPQVAVGLLKELIEKDKVDVVIGPSHSHVVVALRPIVHETKTILLNPNAGAVPLAGEQCSPYIFVTGRMNPLYAETLGRYLAKSGIKNVAVLAANYAGGIDIVNGLKDAYIAEQAGGKVVGELLPPLTTKDFAPYMNQLKGLKADAAFAFFAGDLAVDFIKAYDQAGLKGKLPLYVTGYTVEQDVLPKQGDSALGILSVSVYSPLLDNSTNRHFAPAFKDKYGTYPSEYSVLAYDAAQLLVAAANATQGNVKDKDALIKALESAKFDSPRGNFKFGPNHTPVQDAYLREVIRTPDHQLVNKMITVAWPNYYYPGEGCSLVGVKK